MGAGDCGEVRGSGAGVMGSGAGGRTDFIGEKSSLRIRTFRKSCSIGLESVLPAEPLESVLIRLGLDMVDRYTASARLIDSF